MLTSTETSVHDSSRDDTKQFGETFDDVFGKPWYERDDNETESK